MPGWDFAHTRDESKSVHFYTCLKKKVREKSRECHNHKPQPFPDTKRKKKQTKPNKHKSNNCRRHLFAWRGLYLVINGTRYAWSIFRHFWQERELFFFLLPVCFLVHQTPFEKRSTLKGKNLFPEREKGASFSLGVKYFRQSCLPRKFIKFLLKTLRFKLCYYLE